MTKIERHQVPVYFAALLVGSVCGLLLPDLASKLEGALWPMVATLLYFTFLQVPLLQFRRALTDVRFLAAMLTANFVFVPVMVWCLLKQVLEHARQLTLVTAAFVIYTVLATFVGRFAVWLFALPSKRGRGVVFSTATRNSFVVLPLALALPAGWELAVAVIVIQAFVELLGMLVLIRLVPVWLLPDPK